MTNYFEANTLWYLVQQSDPISKIVLLILLLISVLCWMIFFSKLLLFSMRSRSINRAYQHLLVVKNMDDLVRLSNQQAGTASGHLLLDSKRILDRLQTPSRAVEHWDMVQYRIDQTLESLMMQEESYLPALSTSAAVAPLLGLFGTVWGLVHAFIRISEKQAADITVVAPGIAEALITTLAGLMVAIPALIMYNYLLMRVRWLEHQMVQFADQMAMLEQQFLTE